MSFARELTERAFAAREALAGRDARTLARDILDMSQEEFSAAFKGSPMKRAKLRGLKRNAAMVLGNLGTESDVPPLVTGLTDVEPVTRSRAAWALGRVGSPVATTALRERSEVETDAAAREEVLAALDALEAEAPTN